MDTCRTAGTDPTQPEVRGIDDVLRYLRAFSDFAECDQLSDEDFRNYRLRDYSDWSPFDRKALPSFIAEILAAYGVAVVDAELKELSRPDTRMMEIAEFIARRATVRRPGPCQILGKTCWSAGLFRELARISSSLSPRAQNIGPSTEIATVLNTGQQAQLITRLAATVPAAIDAHDLWRRHASGWVAGRALALAGVGALLCVALPLLGPAGVLLGGYTALVGCSALPIAALAAMIWCLRASFARSRFRRDVRTYRHLVNALLPYVARPTSCPLTS